MYNKPIPWEKKAKYLGVVLDQHLTFAEHVKQARARAAFAQGGWVKLEVTQQAVSLEEVHLKYGQASPLVISNINIISDQSLCDVSGMNRVVVKIGAVLYFLDNAEEHLGFGQAGSSSPSSSPDSGPRVLAKSVRVQSCALGMFPVYVPLLIMSAVSAASVLYLYCKNRGNSRQGYIDVQEKPSAGD